jgi:sigma-E factor negative regulatory protein RseB
MTCVWPATRSIVVEPRAGRVGLPAAIPEPVSASGEQYVYRLGGATRIAGLPCRLVDVEPRDDYRYGHRLCIAEDTGMLLKSEILDLEREVIEQMMFTSIRLMEAIPDEHFRPELAEEGFVWHRAAGEESAAAPATVSRWTIGSLPPGFRIKSQVERRIAASPLPVQHLIATDGVASVSVFVSRIESEQDLYHGVTGTGALNAYGTVVSDYQVTVVGEVPEATVVMIGESVAPATSLQ